MSETDDTDVLLLIPPNFFLVQSSESEDSILESSRTVVHKPLSCTAQVLDKLVNQVQTLETRLDSLEITSDISSLGTKSKRKTLDTTDSIDSYSVDGKCFTFPRRRRRKTLKKDYKRDLSLTSLDSTSTRAKSIPLLRFEEKRSYYHKHTDNINDTRSMDGDISSIVSTPNKKNDKLLLNEIDEFLTKVETYECPDPPYQDREISLSPDNLIKATGDYISRKLDSKLDDDQIKLPSGRMVSSSVLDKYIYLVKGNPPVSQTDKSLPVSSSKTQYTERTVNQTVDSTLKPENRPQETKSPSIRRLNFSDKDMQPTSTPKRTTQSYLDTFKPTSNKIYDRATKVLEQYKAQNSHTTQSSTTENYSASPQKEEFTFPKMRPYGLDNRENIRLMAVQNKLLDTIDTDLLSLSELWGVRGEREKAQRIDCVKLEEERLKREHCEVMIQQLQKKILDQQEKLAVAIKVDRAKDAAIAKLKEAWLRITSSLDKAEERHRMALEKMVREVENFRMVADDSQKKTNHFEVELYKTLDLAHDYQEKCKQLTTEKKELQEAMDKALASQKEAVNSMEKEIEVIKDNYDTVMRLNKQSTDCVRNLEEALEKEKSDHGQTQLKLSESIRRIQMLTDDSTLLMQERDILKEKVNEERARCNIVERQLDEKQNLASELLRKCDSLDNETKTLRKHMELQKNELKCHYQRQLEEAVMSKLQEFQKQLDATEREMENEARAKETTLLESFKQQVARIEEQHKLEVNVLEEKQREEIKLYRLQLAQASEKIGLLENKLESYRRRRSQIASQLHSVMESQWRQALLILTSSHGHPLPPAADGAHDRVPALCPEYVGGRPPPPLPPPPPATENAFNFDSLSDNELQHYVKLLLTKPANMDGSGDGGDGGSRDLPEEPTSDRPDRDKSKAKRSLNSSKPPWKS